MAEGPVQPRRSLLLDIAALEELVDQIASADPDDLGPEAAAEASVRIFRATERLTAQRLGWLGRVWSGAFWAGTGYKSFASWIAGTHQMSFYAATRESQLALKLRDVLGRTAQWARAGVVSTAVAGIIAATANTPARIAALTSPASDGEPGEDGSVPTGEDTLLELAVKFPLHTFRNLAKRFATVADPDADERGYKEALEREFLDIDATTDGYSLSGFLTLDHGQALKTAIDAINGVPAADDKTSATRRRAQGLADLARAALDHALTKDGFAANPRNRPHLSIMISWSDFHYLTCHNHGGGARDGLALEGVDLRRLITSPPPSWEDGSGPVPVAVLQEIAQDCDTTRVVFGPDSQVIDVGRTKRTFSGYLRRAVVARDGSCVWPGCGAPAKISETHHAVRHWADGGVTRVSDGALLCGFHHDYVDAKGIPMRWRPGRDGMPGRWEFGRAGTYSPFGLVEFPQDQLDPDAGLARADGFDWFNPTGPKAGQADAGSHRPADAGSHRPADAGSHGPADAGSHGVVGPTRADLASPRCDSPDDQAPGLPPPDTS